MSNKFIEVTDFYSEARLFIRVEQIKEIIRFDNGDVCLRFNDLGEKKPVLFQVKESFYEIKEQLSN